HRSRPPALLLNLVETDVGRNSIEPILERSTPIESIDAFPRTEHHFLRRVFRIEERSKHPVAITGDRPAVSLETLDIRNNLHHDHFAGSCDSKWQECSCL